MECGLAGRRQSAAEPYRVIAEPGANLIHCALEPSWPIEFAVEQGRPIGRNVLDDGVGPDPDQPKPGEAIGLAGEQGSGGAEQGCGQLGGVG